MAPSKKKEVKGATTPPGLLSKLCQKLKTDNIELPPMVEKKLVFGNSTQMKLKNYEIDWFNPEVITSKCNMGVNVDSIESDPFHSALIKKCG